MTARMAQVTTSTSSSAICFLPSTRLRTYWAVRTTALPRSTLDLIAENERLIIIHFSKVG